MTKKHLFAAITMILISGMIFYTGCKPNGHGKGHAFALDYISETLDLTESQESQLAEIQKEIKAKMKALYNDKQAVRDTLKKQIAADQMDKNLILSLVAEHREKMDQMVTLIVDRVVVFHKGLSPDQKTKLIKKIEKFESWHDFKS